MAADQMAIPLTTVFTPPAACFNDVYTQSTSSIFYKDLDSAFGPCGPPGLATVYASSTYFSPGVCPSGYLPGSYYPPNGFNGVTALFCCPSGYTAFSTSVNGGSSDGGGAGCARTASTPTAVVLNGETTTVTSATFFTPQVFVAWHSSDLSLFDPPSAPLRMFETASTAPITGSQSSATDISTTSTRSVIPSATSDTPASNGSSPEAKTNGLSTGAQAGIGVGVGVAALLLIALAFWVFLRRKKRRAAEEAKSKAAMHASVSNTDDGLWPKELSSSQRGPYAMTELPPNDRPTEMRGSALPAEMEAKSHRAELPGY